MRMFPLLLAISVVGLSTLYICHGILIRELALNSPQQVPHQDKRQFFHRAGFIGSYRSNRDGALAAQIRDKINANRGLSGPLPEIQRFRELEQVLPGPIVVLPNDTPGQNSTILDAIMNHQLPIIYPARLPVLINTTSIVPFMELETIQWSHPAIRNSGIGPDAVAIDDGGLSVVGNWPDVWTNLNYIPILKNAHTSLANAFGDLRQRIQNSTVTVNNCKQAQQMKRRIHTLNSAEVIITVLRDPVDRFISSTCEDFRQRARNRKACFHTDNLTSSIDCVLNSLTTSKPPANLTYFLHHQMPQSNQLKAVMNGIDRPVSVIYFDQIGQLMYEIGCSAKKVRDRKNTSYVRSMPTYKVQKPGQKKGSIFDRLKERLERVTLEQGEVKIPSVKARRLGDQNAPQKLEKEKGVDSILQLARGKAPILSSTLVKEDLMEKEHLGIFCKLTGLDLDRRHLDLICEIYQADVKLLRSIGFDVPLCKL